ncbi:hypothetical protein CBER1_02715 [Cercospora berteroae]|uniref:Uncharacterized protein n=1 Tax=Cercospora berteroae TaxID=357750 RepID=A0A2S6C6R3_9PEZI|nr:hypothetical protein CBER1_02715 [Cercospora berteroae]
MENVQDWANYLYEQHGHNLPEGLRQQIPVFAPNPTYWSYIRSFYSYFNQATSLFRPVLNAAIDSVSTKPDLATVALLLVIIFISLKILNMVVGTVLWWFRFIKGVVFYGGLMGLALWMYTRGPAGVAEDLGYWWGVWKGEYAHWSEQERVARIMREQGIPAGGGRGRANWY